MAGGLEPFCLPGVSRVLVFRVWRHPLRYPGCLLAPNAASLVTPLEPARRNPRADNSLRKGQRCAEHRTPPTPASCALLPIDAYPPCLVPTSRPPELSSYKPAQMSRTSPAPFPPHTTPDDLLADEAPNAHAPSSAPAPQLTGPGAALSPTPDRPPAAQDDDIEMGHISAGHRRRRSSILNPIVAPTRTRARSLSQAIPLQDEAKILEEGNRSPASGDASGGSRGTTDYSEGSVSDEDLHDDEETGLTRAERERRRRAKSRNTLLDQRIAPEKMTVDEKDEADQTVVKTLLVNVGLIGLWYIFSLSISLVSPAHRSPLFPQQESSRTHKRCIHC